MRSLDEQSRTRAARLAGVLDDGVHERRQRRLEIGIGKDDLRRFPAELQRYGAMTLRGRCGDGGTRRRRSGEGQVLHARVLDQRCARFRPESRDDTERAGRQAGFGRQLSDAQQRKACVFGGLHDTSIARGERAADRTAEDLQRIVPWDHVTGDAVRLAPRQHRVAIGIGNRRAVQLVGCARVELEIPRTGGRVRARL